MTLKILTKNVLKGFALVIVLAGTGCQILNKASSAPYSGETQKPIVFFGDSITTGCNINGDGEDVLAKAFPAIFQMRVKAPVINAGVSGDSTTEALCRIQKDVLSRNPQAVIIFLGINDILLNHDIWFINYNFEAILSNLVEADRKIYMVRFYPDSTLYECMLYQGMNKQEQADLIVQLNGLLKNLKEKYNVEIIENIWDDVWGIHTPDGLHPSEAGHKLMGIRIFEALEPYLRSRDLL